MKKWLSNLTLLLLAVLLWCACTNITKTYTIENSKIEIKAGKIFKIKLKANSTTGFEWEQNNQLNAEFLEMINSDYQPDKPVRTGSGGWQIYTYKAIKPGVTTISLKYWRNWEPYEVAQVAEFEVVIK